MNLRFLIFLLIYAISSYTHGQDFNPMNFGAVGNGTADDTSPVQQAINAAINSGGGVTFPEGKTFAVKKINVINGIRYMRGGSIKFLEVPNNHSGFTLLGIYGNQSENVKNLTIENITFDHNNIHSRAIMGWNVSRIRVNNCTFLNRTDNGYSIFLQAHSNGGEDMYDNVITNNTIYGVNDKGESISIKCQLNLGGLTGDAYWVTNKAVAPSNYRAYNTIIANNYIDGGYYGIGLTKVLNTLIENNTIKNNTRNISMQQESSYGIVRNNKLFNSISGGISMARGSSYNLIENNTITTNVSRGEALIGAYIGVSNNVIRNNVIDVDPTNFMPSWMIYVAIHSNNNIFDNNTLSGNARRAYIGVETGWDSSISDPSHLGSYAGPDNNNYASQGISGLQITNNTITPGNSTRRILITEVKDAFGEFYLTNAVIANNTITNDPNYCVEVLYDGITSFDNNQDGVVDACSVNTGTITTLNDCPDITNENGATVVAKNPFIQLPENIYCEQPLTIINYDDSDGGNASFSISPASPDATFFSINQQGVLKFEPPLPSAAPDFENPSSSDLDNIYTAIVEVTDDTNPNYRDVQIYSVEITDQTIEGFAGVTIRVFLEGPYENGGMSTALNAQRGLLPGQTPTDAGFAATPAGQPYNVPPWNYEGREGMGYSDTDYHSGAVDWILVSFRTGIDKSTEIAQTAAILLSNGTVDFPDCAMLPVAAITNNPVYIVVEHRNHMGVMSHEPLSMATGLYYDFALEEGYKGSNGVSQKKLAGNGFPWLMIAGDSDQSDLPSYDINGNDKILWSLENGAFNQYTAPDFNMDGDVNGADRLKFVENNGIFSNVPK